MGCPSQIAIDAIKSAGFIWNEINSQRSSQSPRRHWAKDIFYVRLEDLSIEVLQYGL